MSKMLILKGMEVVVRNMRARDKKLGSIFAKNLKKAGRYLQRKSMEVVPVQTGKLKASAFTRALGTGWKTDVVVGYGKVRYAVYVHEDMNAAHGAAFNAKYASLIATRNKRKRAAKAAGLPFTVVTDPYFKRGENQQAKFLEAPAKAERAHILKIVAGKII